ncbi:MAG: DUF2339 domain-containing protein [Firmicutes bacterium]|nr:DUF2339 domain-containing protein [Bacillota bacterium]
MDVSKLKELIIKQSELADEISLLNDGLSEDGLLCEVDKLKKENESLCEKNAEIRAQMDALDAENKNLKEALLDQMRAEKSRFLKSSEERMAIYFNAATCNGLESLSAAETNIKARFEKCREALIAESEEVYNQFDEKIAALEGAVEEEICRLKAERGELCKTAQDDYDETISSLGGNSVSDETAEELVKLQNNKVERVVGLSILGKVGAVIIIIGMIVLAQLVYVYLTDIVKCVFFFLVATLILGFGLFLNRKKKKRTPFSITILSLGVALEYTALSLSYFVLNILNVYLALGLCIVITALAYVISLTLKSEVVASFAQIGGYLPILAIYGDMPLLYGAMVYFLILNVLGFMLSAKYKWQALNIISFVLSTAAVIFVSISVAIMSIIAQITGFSVAEGITLLYMLFAFALHILLPVITNIRKKTKFTKTDFVLMSLSTVISLIMFYGMFHVYSIGAYTGYLSLGFAAVYFGLYFLLRKFFKSEEGGVQTLFWLTGIVFVALFVPMHNHFDTRWLSFGLVLQSAALIVYGILRKRNPSFYTGLGLAVLSLFFFLISDVFIFVRDDIFIYKYLLLTLASVAVLVAAMYKKHLRLGIFKGGDKTYKQSASAPAQVYAAAVYVNLAGFILHCIYRIFNAAAPKAIAEYGTVLYLMLALMVGVLFAFAVAVPVLFKAAAVHKASIAVAIAGILFLLVINSIRLPSLTEGTTGGRVGASFIMVAVTLASLYVFANVYIKLSPFASDYIKSPRNGLIMASALYFIFWFTLILLHQYRLRFINVTFSIAYLVIAAICLGLGLYRRSALTRRFALVLTFSAIGKLFIVDMWLLETLYRVIGLFACGGLLVGMSFLYQLFYKRFEKRNKANSAD